MDSITLLRNSPASSTDVLTIRDESYAEPQARASPKIADIIERARLLTFSDGTIKGLTAAQIEQIHDKNLNSYITLFKQGARIFSSSQLDPVLEIRHWIFRSICPVVLQCVNPVSIPTPKKNLTASIQSIDVFIREIFINQLRKEHPDYDSQISVEDLRYSIKAPTSKKLKYTSRKVIQTLERCGLLEKKGRVNQNTLNKPNVHRELKSALTSRKIAQGSTHRIMDTLHCINFRSEENNIHLRLTRSPCLNPRILSEMSGGRIPIDMASAVLVHIAIADNKGKLIFKKGDHWEPSELGKPIYILDPLTNCFEKTVMSRFNGNDLPHLQFVPLGATDYTAVEDQYSKDFENLSALFDKMLISDAESHKIKDIIIQSLEPFSKYFSKDLWFGFRETLEKKRLIFQKDIVDLYNWMAYPNPLPIPEENELGDQEAQKLEEKLAQIEQYLEDLCEESKKVIEECPSPSAYNILSFKHESGLKLAVPVEKLRDIFNRFKHIIDHFIRYSAKEFTLSESTEFDISWRLNCCNIQERIKIEKSCAISRRVLLGNKDLPYFSKSLDDDSVVKRWKKICLEHEWTDSILAQKCLELYTKGHLEVLEDARIFISFIVFLLLGKEPALDQASILSNFIMLMSVNLGIHSFEEALKKMPVIPGGSVATKQFILHTTSHPLDSTSWTIPSRPIEESYFLPYTNSLLGSAENELQRYDDVATTAVKCCQKLLDKISSFAITNLIEIEDHLNRKTTSKEELAARLDDLCVYDDDDLVGKWAINFFTCLCGFPIEYRKIPTWSKEKVARKLFLNLNAQIDNGMVEKVTQVDNYLAKQGFRLEGVPADGNCFFYAFYDSSRSLPEKHPLKGKKINSISYLRSLVADQLNLRYPSKQARAKKIRNSDEWIAASEEGDLLATALNIPIRVVTVNKDETGFGINDMLTFQGPEGESRQEWKALESHPEDYIFILDLGHHFISARPWS